MLVRINYRLTLGYRSRITVHSVLQLMTKNDQHARAEMMIYTRVMQLDNDNLSGSKRLDRTTAADWLEFAELFPPSVDLLTIDDRNMAGSIEKRINGEREKVRKFWPISSCGFIQS